MGTVDLTPTPTLITVAQDNDKIISAGPFTLAGVVIPRTGKRLRFVVKAKDTTADASALIDIDSVNDSARVYGVGADETGVWAVDIRNILPPPLPRVSGRVGSYHFRVDLTAESSLDTDREEVGVGALTVKPT